MLKNKRIVVTGGASGIGAAIVAQCVAAGAKAVHVIDIDGDKLAASVAQYSDATLIHHQALDVQDREALTDWLISADQSTQGFDIVFNNAGVMSGGDELLSTPVEHLLRVIDINLIATMIGTRIAAECMSKRGIKGVIINTASTAAFNAMPADPAYAASKAAVVNFTQSCMPLAEQYGIRVHAVCPGVTDTAIVPRNAEWLKPALAAVQWLTPDEIVDVMEEVLVDSNAPAYRRVDNAPRSV